MPDATIDATGLSSIRRGIASHIGRNTNQPQTHVEMEVDAEQLSPTTLGTQLAAYQNTVKDLHDQNERNAELLRRLEAIVTKKDSEISHLRIKETQKDLRIEAQQQDFQGQLIAEQTACQQVSSTLQGLQQELEALRAEQNGHNPMDVSSSTDANNDHLKNLQEEVTNYLPPTVNKKCAAAISTDDTFGDWTLGGDRNTRHVHFASTPVKPEVSNIHLTTPPCTPKEETIAESILQNTMQTLTSELKCSREPKIQKFRGGTSSGVLLVFSEGSAHDNINFYLEVTERPSIEGLFKNLKQVLSSGEYGQQMLTKFYSHTQSSKESVKELGKSLLQIA